MISTTRVATLCSLAALLVSCSGEPSANDISKALNDAIQIEQKQLKGLTAGLPGGTGSIDKMMSIEVADLEKIGCKESGEKAYICDVRYTMRGGMFGKTGRPVVAPVRMVNAKEGWAASAR